MRNKTILDRALPAHYRLTGGDVAGIAGPFANMIMPGLGSVFSAAGQIWDQAKAKSDSYKQYDQFKTSTNSFGYAAGGELKGKADFATYNGNSHAQSGIKTSTTGIPTLQGPIEVEGKETLVKAQGKNYIFSHQLKV